MKRRSLLRSGILSLCLLGLLQGCGFHLRGSQPWPEHAKVIAINSSDRYSSIYLKLLKRLQEYRVQFSDTASYRLEVGEPQVNRRPVAVASDGKAGAYRLSIAIDFTWTPVTTGITQRSNASTERVYTFDEDNRLGKEREEQLLREEMEQELVQQIINQIRRL